jgi:minimal PKS chain-length factor (CLF/KS beta)
VRDAIAVSGTGIVPPSRRLEEALAARPEPVRTRAARAERITQLALAAGGEALADAGLESLDGPPRPELGVVVGTAFGCFLTNAAYQRRLAEGGPAAASPRLFAATVSNAAAGELGIAYRLGGPAVTLTAGCAAGLVAVGHAADLVEAGRGTFLAGGVDAVGEPLERWIADGGLEIDRPPADAAAFVVLEPLRAARARRARVRGTIAGHASGFEPAPETSIGGCALAAAIRHALDGAALTPADIDVVLAAVPSHLSALRDRAFAAALDGATAEQASVTDAVGETFAAAGPLALEAAVHAGTPGRTVLVVDVCPSGYVAALIVHRGDPA